jgi:integrative and conjugative element protein (TIGR02256 family)
VRFAQAALDCMQDEAYGTRNSSGSDVETGGMLLGQIDDPSRVIWVTSATGPSPDSRQSSSYVSLGTSGARELVTAIQRNSKGRIRFIGMWHTHPHTLPYESQTDQQAMDGLLTNTEHPLYRALLVTLGAEPAEWEAWLEGSGTPAIYTRFAHRPPKQKPDPASK